MSVELGVTLKRNLPGDTRPEHATNEGGHVHAVAHEGVDVVHARELFPAHADDANVQRSIHRHPAHTRTRARLVAVVPDIVSHKACNQTGHKNRAMKMRINSLP